jgi:predicted DCC family thiol-disulfide oxidoreductase YuxK
MGSYVVGLVGTELIHDIRLLLCTGRHVHGADVYRFVMRCIWRAYLVYVLSIAPGFSWLFDQAYRAFARNRFGVSRACRLRNGSAA